MVVIVIAAMFGRAIELLNKSSQRIAARAAAYQDSKFKEYQSITNLYNKPISYPEYKSLKQNNLLESFLKK